MGYRKRNGGWADTDEVTLFGPASRPSTITSDPVEIGDRGSARLDLVVTSGNGTLDVAIQTSADGVNNWTAVASFTQATGATSQHKLFGPIDRFVRAVATIGTGPFDFSVKGEAV